MKQNNNQYQHLEGLNEIQLQRDACQHLKSLGTSTGDENLMSPIPMDIMLTCFSLNVREQKQMTSATPVHLARNTIGPTGSQL